MKRRAGYLLATKDYDHLLEKLCSSLSRSGGFN